MTGVYVYSGNPFQPGPLPVSNVTLNKVPDGIPEHTEGRYYAASLVVADCSRVHTMVAQNNRKLLATIHVELMSWC